MYKKILEILLEKNDYVSGEELGKLLNISRSAVWKNINKLRENGYEIDSVTKKGYKILNNNDILNEAEIKSAIKNKSFIKKIYYYDQVDSTNNELKHILSENTEEGIIVVSDIQTSGRGRLGRTWVSPKQTGIYISLSLTPNIMPFECSSLTLVAALAVSNALKNVCNVPASIKWPNDILINNKKVCGILTEMSAEIDKLNYIIIGTGINVSTEFFDEELNKTATSIFLETNKKFERKKIISEFLFEFEKYYNKFCEENGFSEILEEYKQNCITLNKKVKVLCKESFLGTAVGVTEKGELIVKLMDGEERVVSSGEVSIR